MRQPLALIALIALIIGLPGLPPVVADGGGGGAGAAGFFGAIREARELHDRGVDGDKQAVVACIARLEDLLEENPGNQLARVYLGSAYTLRSRDLFPGPEKLGKLIEGGRLMDEAVASDPDNLRVRFVRALNYYHLPAIFGKRGLARDELIAIAGRLPTCKDRLDARERQGMLYYGALALDAGNREAEARDLLRRAAEAAPDSELAPVIRGTLAEWSRER